MSTSTPEDWSATAPNYAKGLGQIPSFAARRLISLAHSHSPITPSSQILDVGAGTGAIALTLAAKYPSTKILATDISQGMLETISSHRLPNVSTESVDAGRLVSTLGEEQFTHAFCTFMLQTILKPRVAVREIFNVLAPGAAVGIGIWGQHLGAVEIWRRAAQSLDPSYILPPPFDDEHAWRTAEELSSALAETGFVDIKIEKVDIPSPFGGVDGYMKAWFEGKNPTAEKCMSSWPRERMGEVRDAAEMVLKEEFDEGREFYTQAVLGVGRKPG